MSLGAVDVPYDIPKGCAATYFPEANEVVPLQSFAEGETPSSKSVPIRIKPHDPLGTQ